MKTASTLIWVRNKKKHSCKLSALYCNWLIIQIMLRRVKAFFHLRSKSLQPIIYNILINIIANVHLIMASCPDLHTEYPGSSVCFPGALLSVSWLCLIEEFGFVSDRRKWFVKRFGSHQVPTPEAPCCLSVCQAAAESCYKNSLVVFPGLRLLRGPTDLWWILPVAGRFPSDDPSWQLKSPPLLWKLQWTIYETNPSRNRGASEQWYSLKGLILNVFFDFFCCFLCSTSQRECLEVCLWGDVQTISSRICFLWRSLTGFQLYPEKHRDIQQLVLSPPVPGFHQYRQTTVWRESLLRKLKCRIICDWDFSLCSSSSDESCGENSLFRSWSISSATTTKAKHKS